MPPLAISAVSTFSRASSEASVVSASACSNASLVKLAGVARAGLEEGADEELAAEVDDLERKKENRLVDAGFGLPVSDPRVAAGLD